mmetsp:Transcript_57402/g.177953  ORF Transcript_57402/g.177953 Transcript_57402/m.177953 type:complete len:291 (+) Transcript_57402:210-1082(+)
MPSAQSASESGACCTRRFEPLREAAFGHMPSSMSQAGPAWLQQLCGRSGGATCSAAALGGGRLTARPLADSWRPPGQAARSAAAAPGGSPHSAASVLAASPEARAGAGATGPAGLAAQQADLGRTAGSSTPLSATPRTEPGRQLLRAARAAEEGAPLSPARGLGLGRTRTQPTRTGRGAAAAGAAEAANAASTPPAPSCEAGGAGAASSAAAAGTAGAKATPPTTTRFSLGRSSLSGSSKSGSASLSRKSRALRKSVACMPEQHRSLAGSDCERRISITDCTLKGAKPGK